MWRSYSMNDDRYSDAEPVVGLDVDTRTPLSAQEGDVFPVLRNKQAQDAGRCEWMVRIPPGFVSC